jgi:cell division protein FtsX
MPFELSVAQAAPALSIELSTVVSIAAIAITILLALLTFMVALAGWTGKREIARNDEAHRKLEASVDTSRRELRADVKGIEGDVKRLLEGQARVEATLDAQISRRAVRPEDTSLVDSGPTAH